MEELQNDIIVISPKKDILRITDTPQTKSAKNNKKSEISDKFNELWFRIDRTVPNQLSTCNESPHVKYLIVQQFLIHTLKEIYYLFSSM